LELKKKILTALHKAQVDRGETPPSTAAQWHGVDDNTLDYFDRRERRGGRREASPLGGSGPLGTASSTKSTPTSTTVAHGPEQDDKRERDQDEYESDPKKYGVDENRSRRLHNMIREEVETIVKEVEEKRPQIDSKLESMRKELIKNGGLNIREVGSARNDIAARPEKRIPLASVAKVIDIPVNELILHFLNGHRISEGQALIEYRLGCVHFYGDPEIKVN
jgi:hypothetical protein